MVSFYQKLYALIHTAESPTNATAICHQLHCLQPHLQDLHHWWQNQGQQLQDIGSASDRVNLHPTTDTPPTLISKHPISGQSQSVPASLELRLSYLNPILPESDIQKVFCWFWRFYPELLASQDPNALLIPAHKILPDCPHHSYTSTISALAGAIPHHWQPGYPNHHPYLFLFTFSPVQDFIKASRKFLDFWAGSYLLHYLSAKLCWQIAQDYGADAVITPSLWSQEIIDAFILHQYPDFATTFAQVQQGTTPVSRFLSQQSTSLSTAGFPNVITAIVPGKSAAEALGKHLSHYLTETWFAIAHRVREDIKQQVIAFLQDPANLDQQTKIIEEFPPSDRPACQRDLQKWQHPSCWEWNKLWDAQIHHTWEPYWTAVPLGHPDHPLIISKTNPHHFDPNWKHQQNAIAPSRGNQSIPTPAEEQAYDTLNAGTWWGNGQSRLGQLIQSVKNTRTWQIPTAPGERSTLSGQFSAVHPHFHYHEKLREGAGVAAGSMRLFWRVMAQVYPGLFNGSEKLNALELTKRMAWIYGGVAESLGIGESLSENGETSPSSLPQDSEHLIRFPNLTSIAAARFAHTHPDKIRHYWRVLRGLIQHQLSAHEKPFCQRTRNRPFHVPKTDHQLNPHQQNGQNFNGVMFSSKWLAEDLGLNRASPVSDTANSLETLRQIVDTAHQQLGFTNGSPGDWWVIILADGDGMGKYVSGRKLKAYKDYLIPDYIEPTSQTVAGFSDLLHHTQKRMGPATHIGLNRALLDFSNRLVPYLTEKRFCGKVVYSGGDDVMAVLPLEDLPEFVQSLRAAWCGGDDPKAEFKSEGGYWHCQTPIPELPHRPLFTMGEGATMSMGIVIAHKTVPLPTVLENLWSAEKDRAKQLKGTPQLENEPHFPDKDGLCFRVIYGGGNTLEALMKGNLLTSWWTVMQPDQDTDMSPLLYRLAETLPQRAYLTASDRLLSKAALVIINRRDETLSETIKTNLCHWLDEWEQWAFYTQKYLGENALGTQPQDLANLLRFSAFWVDKMRQRNQWVK